jgi:energy-coupling factor transporter ATP-binding protein EcfA2
MSEPTLIQEQRAILRRLRQTTAHHSQLTTAADAQWHPATLFQSSIKNALHSIQELQALMQTTPTSWQQSIGWAAHPSKIVTPICSIAFSPDGRLVASGGSDHMVKIWEVHSGRLLQQLIGHASTVRSVDFSSDGRLLASGSGDKTVKMWEISSGHLLQTLSNHTEAVSSVAFSPDSRLLASGSADKTVKVWEVNSGRLLHTLSESGGFIDGVAFSPNGHLLAAAETGHKTVRVWEVASGRLIYTLKHGGSMIWLELVATNRVAFSPDSRLLASANVDKTVKIWEVASGRLLRTLSGHTDYVRSVAFSPDGRLLASGSADRTVKVWEVSTGQLLQDLRWTHRVDRVSFSPDGHWLAISGETQIQLFQGTWQILALYRQWQDSFNRYDRPAPFPWQDRRWQDWAASTQAEQDLLRLGEMQKLTAEQQLEMPALLAFPTSRSLLFKTAAASRAVAARAVQSLLLRLLASLPPGKLRFTFIDPVGLGQNAAPFMHLADYDEQLVTGKAWSEPQHIEQRLADLTEHMENVIQQYLRNQYATIEDYNAQAGEIAEPYRVLVVFDFPVNFSETAARRLVSIAQNGPRCGVYAVILMDTDKVRTNHSSLPYGFNPADLEQNAEVIAWQDGRWVWQDEDFKECTLELDAPPPAERFNRIVTAVGEAAKAAGKVEVPFERIAPPREQWWRGDSRSGIRVPLGPAGARKVQELALGQGTAQHVLVAGKTGSGKSTLLHTLITNLALAYSPDEVELYLIDFKKGVEFKTYATHQLPHARVVAIESEREFGLSVLQGLDAELKRRGDLFRAAGVDHIADYRQKTGQKLPRILLLVDEFQEFFTEDDPISSQASQILDRLVRQGRAFGLHVLLGSQTLAGAYTLARSTIDQMAVRIALQCSEADSRLILADDNPAARLLSRPGEAIYNDANGLVEGNSRFQVAWLPDDKRDDYLAQVVELARQRNYRPPRPQIVFEGNAPAEVEKNRPLYDLLTGSPLLAGEGPGVRSPRRVLAWLGDPIAIRDPIAAAFRRQSGSNLLIVGQNDEAALGMMMVALISLAAQTPSPTLPLPGGGQGGGGVTFYVLDFGAVDAPYAGLWDQLAGILPHPVKVGRRRQLPEFIAELAAEVQQRLDNEQPGAPARYLFLYGLQRARDLRQEEGFGFGGFGEEPTAPNPAQQFTTILREGPDLGIHTLVWCDTMTNLNRSLERRALREFAMRVAFQMSAEDSANLLDSPLASKLGPYRALFYDEEEGRLEKFRPYGLPSEKWLGQVKEWLKGRG